MSRKPINTAKKSAGVWDKMSGLPGEATRTPRRCPNCGQAFYRTHCPNGRCRRNGFAPKTKPIVARAARVAEEPAEVGRVGATTVDSPLNHTSLMNKLAHTTRTRSQPLSKRETQTPANTNYRRDPVNRVN